ncbi:Hypothetical protein, putative [Bodo saltans]|uniref:U-box domain-containing protein n=1 Tax=Bodo saltans TaxID=75058 RepID=A0A0S4J5R0_BODSA|nr:Hypothetical protein, putative [Bodo saltans]|eukprot:CUG84650.1 Hypothetical protein, putative [Bodo saltans]
MNPPALGLLIAPVTVWSTSAFLEFLADSDLFATYVPKMSRAARVMLLRIDRTLPVFSQNSSAGSISLVGCLLCLCRHRSALQALDTMSRFVSVCWRDLAQTPQEVLVDYAAGVVGGISACISVIPALSSTQSIASSTGASMLTAIVDYASLWWSGPRRTSATWVGGSPFVLALSGFRLTFRGDLQASAAVAPAMFRRCLHVYRYVVWPSSVQPESPKMDVACHDWVEISAFSLGMMMGAVGSVGRLALAGFRLRHQRAAFHGRFAVPVVLPEHPVQPSPDLVAAFEKGTAPKEFVCPLTHELFEQPVVAADGHTYEASYMIQWLTMRDTSPTCGTQLPHTELVPNYTLRSLMEVWAPPSNK